MDYIFQAAGRLGRWQEPAILCGDRSVSYEQLFRLVKKCGGMMRALGAGVGDRVAVVASDGPEWVVSFLGTIAAGAICVPSSTMSSAAELRYVLEHCGARILVLTSEQTLKLRGIRSHLPQLENVLHVGGELEGMLSFEQTLDASAEAEIEPVSDDAPAFILYTSGSTGRPKGAVHLHKNLPYTVETCCKRVLKVQPEDRLFSSSRLFFAYGLGNSLSFPLGSGATTILCNERPTPPVIAEIFRRHRPTIFFGVPAVFRALVEYGTNVSKLETDSIKFCISAGEKLPERIFHEWKEMTGLDILDGIGSTEMLQMFISNTRDRVVPGSSGQIVPGYEAKLIDQEGREVTGAGMGNLLIKGGSACAGYWLDEEKTAALMQGEWMRTGDLYRRDEEGNFWHEGRSDDVFKVKGLWVSPLEVEDALMSCDDVLEAAIVPGVNRDGMNTVTAYVVLKSREVEDPAADERLKAQVSRKLAPYKCPTEIHFVEQLPRTATGKIQRFKLREQELRSSSARELNNRSSQV